MSQSQEEFLAGIWEPLHSVFIDSAKDPLIVFTRYYYMFNRCNNNFIAHWNGGNSPLDFPFLARRRNPSRSDPFENSIFRISFGTLCQRHESS
jgi:hypothetical protein